MGELLFKKFLEEEVEDVQKVITCSGVEGLMHSFERWLIDNNYIKCTNGYFKKWE